MMGVLFLLVRLITLLVALALVKPMGPKLLVSGGFLLLLCDGFLARLLHWTDAWMLIYDTNFMLGELLGVGMTGVELLAYLILLVGLVMMKPAAAS